MEPKRDLAIVLRSIPYEERHRVVTALTENHGVLSALARNSIQSRRFGGTLEPFAAAEWMFVEKPGAELVRLDEARIRRSFEGLRKDFERLSMASLFNELMLRVASPRTPSPALFRLHSNALALLEEGAGASSVGAEIALLNAYLAKIFHWSGLQPRLAACLECAMPLENVDADAHVGCLVTSAGWLCPSCRSPNIEFKVTPLVVLDLIQFALYPLRQGQELKKSSEKEHRELFKFLEALLVYHLPGLDKAPLKSLRFLALESSVPHPAASPR